MSAGSGEQYYSSSGNGFDSLKIVGGLMGYFLHSSKGSHIPVGLSMRIGSDPGCDIVVKVGEVASCHAIIGSFPDGLLIRDEDSSTGTYVNNERIEHVTTLLAGDRIKVGKKEFVVEYEHTEI
jgi:pSer/pThr/pTyr-binding forkhead associated (FHA) protein